MVLMVQRGLKVTGEIKPEILKFWSLRRPRSLFEKNTYKCGIWWRRAESSDPGTGCHDRQIVNFKWQTTSSLRSLFLSSLSPLDLSSLSTLNFKSSASHTVNSRIYHLSKIPPPALPDLLPNSTTLRSIYLLYASTHTTPGILNQKQNSLRLLFFNQISRSQMKTPRVERLKNFKSRTTVVDLPIKVESPKKKLLSQNFIQKPSQKYTFIQKNKHQHAVLKLHPSSSSSLSVQRFSPTHRGKNGSQTILRQTWDVSTSCW